MTIHILHILNSSYQFQFEFICCTNLIIQYISSSGVSSVSERSSPVSYDMAVILKKDSGHSKEDFWPSEGILLAIRRKP